MKIGDFDTKKRTFIIAEIGSNHNGDFSLAKAMVRKAAECGVDAVKFQVYNAENLVSRTAPLLSHVKGVHKTQYERFRSLEFSKEQYFELAALAKDSGVFFLASVFDEDIADMLDKIMPAYKIASGDLTNAELISHIAKKNKPIILSTGMATVGEIKKSIALIPKSRLILLHCVSAYPTPMEAANLRAIPFLKKRFKSEIGYSDHTQGILACIAAVALGAVVIEKHFTFDKNIPLGDHKLSLEPDELKQMVGYIRQLEPALGDYGKTPLESEKNISKHLRRSLYAKEDIHKNARISKENIIALRPEDGISAAHIDLIIGKTAKRDILKGQPLKEEYLHKIRRI